MNQPITVFFMGFSGCGKDTQAGLLKAFLEKRDGADSVFYIYTGDELRKLVKEPFYTAKKIQEEVLGPGRKAPDFLAVYAWANILIPRFEPRQHLLFSSSPRTLLEAKILDDMAEFYGREEVYPVFLNVLREEAFQRLKKRGRPDDTDEVINNRLDYFDVKVRPAVEYFRRESANRLVEIDGNPHDAKKIHRDILKASGLL